MRTVLTLLGLATLVAGYGAVNYMTKPSESYDNEYFKENLEKAREVENKETIKQWTLNSDWYLNHLYDDSGFFEKMGDLKNHHKAERQITYVMKHMRSQEQAQKKIDRRDKERQTKAEESEQVSKKKETASSSTGGTQSDEFLLDDTKFNAEKYYYTLQYSIYDRYKRFKIAEITQYDAEGNRTWYKFQYRREDNWMDQLRTVRVIDYGKVVPDPAHPNKYKYVMREYPIVFQGNLKTDIDENHNKVSPRYNGNMTFRVNMKEQLTSIRDSFNNVIIDTKLTYDTHGFLEQTMSRYYKDGKLTSTVFDCYITDDNGFIANDSVVIMKGDKVYSETYFPLVVERSKVKHTARKVKDIWIMRDHNINFDINRLLIPNAIEPVSVLAGMGLCGKFMKGLIAHYKGWDYEYDTDKYGRIIRVFISENGEYRGKLEIAYYGDDPDFPAFMEGKAKSNLFEEKNFPFV